MTGTSAVRRLLALLLLVLLTACGGLPVPSGVFDADGVGGDAPDVGGIVVVAPGPQPQATASELVRGYLYALSRSPQDGHRIARQFLAPDVECCEQRDEALLYENTPGVSVLEDQSVVRVSFDAVGRILDDGSFQREGARVRDDFRVTTVDGELRLESVPPGLRLVADDLERSFTPYDVHFLASDVDGAPSRRLVPDRVFLPVSRGPGQALVDALLSGPSRRLAPPTVLSAAPPGTTAQVDDASGIVTVDLSAEVAALGTRERQRLAAQLVWTLVPAYSGVRLRVQGEALLPDEPAVQDRSDWAVYDPSGAVDDGSLLYLQDRQLRRLAQELPDSDVTTGALPVDGAALSLSGTDLAVRTAGADGLDEVRTGPLRGPFGDPLLEGPGITSLSWGPGDQGLWVLQTGTPVGVWLVPGGDDRTPRRVPLQAPQDTGPLNALKVSRDGARIALVLGGRLHVGRVEPVDGWWRIADVTAVSDLVGVTDVAWRSGTSLVALGALEADGQLLPAEVAVDGSAFAVVQRPLGGAVAVEIAAAPRQPLVVAADVEDERQLYLDDDTLFRPLTPGRSPFYPG